RPGTLARFADAPGLRDHFAPRPVRGDAARELAAGSEGQRSTGVCVYAPKPAPLPLAVVLGLVLRRYRVATLRPRALTPGARESAVSAAPGWLHRPHHL